MEKTRTTRMTRSMGRAECKKTITMTNGDPFVMVMVTS